MKKLLNLVILFSLLFVGNRINAQVGIGTITPDANAQLDISSSDKGLLIPRVTEEARVGMGAAADGLLLYQIDVSKGFYFRQNGQWVKLNTSGSAIIPYASGSPINLTTPFYAGAPGIPVFVGFGSSGSGSTYLGATINQTAAISNHAFSLPRDGVIESVSAYFSTAMFLNLPFQNALTVTAELYRSSTPNNLFVPVSGTKVTLTPALTGSIPLGAVCNGVVTGLNIPVIAQTRLLMVYSISESGSVVAERTLVGHASGGVSIAGE